MMPSLKRSWEYCERALPRVSRTFALNIRALSGELYRCVLLGYLICRILDTVEDSPSLPPQLKGKFLRRFPRIIANAKWEMPLQEWAAELKAQGLDGKTADIDLLEHSCHVLSCFRQLAPDYQQAGERMFALMSQGMAEYSERRGEEPMILRDLEDLQRYCYHVAGVVGEFLFDTFRLAYAIKGQTEQTLREHCVAFGLGLQMTNIAKDIFADRQRGQIFLPQEFLREAGLSKEEFLQGQQPAAAMAAYGRLLEEAHSHLLRGYSFTLAIHRRHFRLRLFCIRPLWMAFETLKTLAARSDLLYSGQDVKISRSQVRKILLSTTPIIASNTLIERSFLRNYRKLGAPLIFTGV